MGGYLLQLRILLWKNLTIKKRSPFVLMFELVIPLVLFVILILIRKDQPPKAVGANYFTALPLPSAGVMSIMQAFCAQGDRDEQGYINLHNATASKFLTEFDQIAHHNNFFDSSFTLGDLDHLPGLYRSIIENPAAVHQIFSQVKNLKVKSLFTNWTQLTDSLHQNFTLTKTDLEAIGNSTLNIQTLYQVLFGDDYRKQSNGVEYSKQRRKRETQVTDNDLQNQYNQPSAGIQNEEDINSIGQGLIGDALSQQIPLSEAAANRDVSEEEREGKGEGEDTGEDFLDFKEQPWRGLLVHALERDPTLLQKAAVVAVLSSILGLNPHRASVNPNIVIDLLKAVLLTPHTMRHLVCDRANISGMDPILEPRDPSDAPKLENASVKLCQLKDAQWTQFTNLLSSQIDSHYLVQKFHLSQIDLSDVRQRADLFSRNLREFIMFEKNLVELSNFAGRLPQDACPVNDNATANGTVISWNGTHHDNTSWIPDVATQASVPADDPADMKDNDEETEQKSKKKKKKNMYSGLLRLWMAMQETICGKPPLRPDQYSDDISLEDLGLTSKQKMDIGILIHVLYSNPKVLYAPNNTDVDRIIVKANESFSLVDSVSAYARKWLNVSAEIREYLDQNSTEQNLHDIRQMQREMHNLPHFSELFVHKTDVLMFAENTSVARRAFFYDQLTRIDNAACSWLTLLDGISLNIFRGFRTEKELVDYVLHQAYLDNVTVLASVVVMNIEPDGSLPPHIVYKIRQNATFTHDTRHIRPWYWFPGPMAWGYNYYQFGFVWVQDVMERAMIDIMVGRDVVEPGSYIHQFPYPCYLQDRFLFMIEHVMPLCLTISWVYTVAMLVRNIVHEKEKRLKEVMKMMGLYNSAHWLAWFLTTYAQMSVTTGVLTLMLHYGAVLQYSNPALIFLTFQTFTMATISFSFLVSVLYSKAKLAAACAGIVYFLTYVPYMYVAIREEAAGDKIPAWAKSIASLFSTTAFGLGSKYFAFYEIVGVGIQWSNMHVSPVENDEYNLLMVLLMMLFDTLLYGVLTWYIENVHPGSYGLPKPWYFPLTRSYWFATPSSLPEVDSYCCHGYKRGVSVTEDDQACAMAHGQEPHPNLEPEPSDLLMGVCIGGLTKRYKSGKLAVNGLTLNLYEGQITSFLGHNGAGKTTTMSILTGLFPPTSGYATIYGHDIRTEMGEIRKSLGMCPQHNVLFDRLTVEEHLWFYARLKGMPSDLISTEMETMLKDMALVEKKNTEVGCLSGGMKRKLSVAIAFVAGSRTVILDEPTAGVDPYARRQIWDLLIKYKQGRTILLSTHHMDEADILGDRIAIISNGRLKCCGGSLFLKNMYGEGYHLTLAKSANQSPGPDANTDQANNTDTMSDDLLQDDLSYPVQRGQTSESAVTAFITQHVSTAYLKSETAQELHYILPFPEAKKGGFEKLFVVLDENLADLGLSSYGLMDTSLEEVFLKVTEQALVAEDEMMVNDEKPQDTFVTNRAPLTSEIVDNQSDVSSMSSTSLLLDLGPGDVELSDMPTFDFQEEYRPTAPVQGDLVSSTRTSISSQSDVSLLGQGDANINALLHTNPLYDDRTSRLGEGPYVVTGHMLLVQQFVAILIKRAVYIRRNWKGLFSQILLPALFVSVAMTVALTAPRVKNPPPMVLSPALYFNYTQPRGNFIPYSNTPRVPEMPVWSKDAGPSRLIQTFRLPSGMAATCLLKTPFNSSFDEAVLRQVNFTYRNYKLLDQYFQPSCRSVFQPGLPLGNFVPPLPTDTPETESSKTRNHSHASPVTTSPLLRRYFPHCYCTSDSRSFICDKTGYDNPPFFQLVTRDIVQDITGEEEQKYYLHTTDMYRLHRYGAFSFGNEREFVPREFGKDSTSLFRKLAVRRVAKVWYNHRGYHSIPIYLNTLNNAILRANLPHEKGNPAAYGITVINHPMDNTDPLHTYDYIMTGSDVLIAIFVIVAMSFVPASFVLFLVYERYTKAKHLQFVAGINRVIYWLANFIWDLCNYLIPALCCIIILKVFDLPAYVSESNFPAVISLFLLYGWSITPMMYPASFVFEEPSTAYIFLIVINLFIGITCLITSYLLEIFQLNDKHLGKYHETLKTIFLVFPNYCLGRGLMDIAFNEYQNEYYFKTGQYEKMRWPLEWNLTLRNLVAMAVIGLVFFLITLLCEFLPGILYCSKKGGVSITEPRGVEDADVVAERNRVLRGSGRHDVLRVQNLTKIYRTRTGASHLALDRLCLGVGRGECFGLLGVNGAGKTTTFRMLTGDLRPSSGDATIDQHSILSELRHVQQSISYCPQFDALYDELTAREHLQLYARLRGVPRCHTSKVVQDLLEKTGLKELADKPSNTYSGGNKRKLSTAIVLVGHPHVIFLDEPTTGMDPHSRRFLWDLILDLVNDGRSIVLTSHSMEECEALCTRLSILVNGRFMCLGSAQHIKARFGDGYTVLVRVTGPEYAQQLDDVQHFMTRHFPLAKLKDSHHNVLQYELSPENVSLSDVFSKLEGQEAQSRLAIDDFSVNQNTLDNVFINFVKQQMEERNGPNEVPPWEPLNTRVAADTGLHSPLLERQLEDSDEETVSCEMQFPRTQLSFIGMEISDG